MKKRMGARGTQVMSDAIPAKFPHNDIDWLDLTVARTGVSRADVIRRSVRLLHAALKANPEWNWIKETGSELPPLSAEELREVEAMRAEPAGGFSSSKVKLPGLSSPISVGAAGKFETLSQAAKADADAERQRQRRGRKRTRS